MSATVGDSAAGGRSAVEPSSGTGVARGPGAPEGGAGGHVSGGGGRGSGPGDGGGSGAGGGASTLTGTVRNRMSTEGLLGSPPGRRKVPRETEWTDFVSKDTAESTKANTYYFCEVSEDCCFARGAPFAFPRKRSSFSGGRAAWISHVLKCVGADELAAQGITKLDAISPCAGQLTLDTPVVKCALRYLNEQRASEAKKQLKLDAARSGGKQLTLEEASARELARRAALTEDTLNLSVASAVVATASALRIIDHPQFREMLQVSHDLGWQRGFAEAQVAARAATVKGAAPHVVHPASLRLPHRTALTRTWLPRVVKVVRVETDAIYRKSAIEGGGALGVDGWKDPTGAELYLSGFCAKHESVLVRLRDTLGIRKNEAFFVKVVIEDVRDIKARGGKVTTINTDGAMTDWHPALRDKLREEFPDDGILVLTCAAHGVSLFFKDVFGIGRVGTNAQRGNGLWTADVLADSIDLIKFIMNHEVLRALFMACPDTLALRLPQEQRMGGAFLVLERLLKDKNSVFALLQHAVVKEYVTNDQYGKKYRGAYNKICDKVIEMPAAGTFWKQLKKAVIALEPVWMLLRLCDKGTPNMASVAMAFEDVLAKFDKLPLPLDVGNTFALPFTREEKDSLLRCFEERKGYVIKPVHRGAALFNPAYYLEPNKTAVPVSWNADLLVLLRELFPGEALAGERAFVREHLERMHKHEAPFDDPDCWSAAAKDPLDIGAWWSRYCHLPVEVELDLTPLREAGVIIGSMQASSGEMERMNKVASNQLTKFRTLLTRQHVEDVSHASHFFQQKNSRAARLRAAGAKSSDRTPLHESTLFHVHAEAVRELREAEREARAEFVRAQMEDPDFEPLAGGMLALLLSTDADTIAETAAVVDSGDGVARLHAASLAKATTAESEHAEDAQARPMAAAPLPPAQRERLTDAGISAEAAALWNLRDDDV
jgi:hypothetical protein